MDIRTILYINIFLLAGCTVGISVIAFHNARFRQFRWLAIAYATGGLGTVMRTRQGHIPDFFSLVLSNVLIVAALLLVHRSFATFVKAEVRTGWLEAVLFVSTLIGMAYYTHIHRSYGARSLLMSMASIGVASLTAYALIHYADAAVRIPCIATASLYVAFALMTVLRCLGIVLWGAPHDFFVSSTAQLLGFFGVLYSYCRNPGGLFLDDFSTSLCQPGIACEDRCLDWLTKPERPGRARST